MSNQKNTKRFERVWRVLFGHVNCCNCGTWALPTERNTAKGKRYIWYCKSCGALLAIKRLRVVRELVIFISLFIFTVPLSLILVSVAAPKPPDILYLVVGLIDALACGLITTYIFVGRPDLVMTRNAKPHGYCFVCGYNLNYSVGDRCSECGEPAEDIIAAIVKWNERGSRAVVD